MKYFQTIIMVCFAHFLLAQSAVEHVSKVQVKQNFGEYAANLSSQQVSVFQQRAEQKIKDFVETISLIQNTKYPQEIREKAINKALKSFSNENIKIKNLPYATQNQTIKEYLNQILKEKSAAEINIQKISISQPFAKNRNNDYATTYTLSLKYGAQKTVNLHVNLLLKRTQKTFGTEKKEVWEVVINGIE